jgi:uncharacterized membrane protein
MTSLIAAAAAFVLIHLLISGTRLRDAITGVVGEGPYMGLFSLASLAAIVWLGFGYAAARQAADPVYWSATPATKWAQLAITFVAFMLIVPGLATPNPTSVRQEGTLDKADVVSGMVRVTRHPFLMGVALWAAGHLLVNGDLASLVLFGALLVVAVLGPLSIDAKRRRKLGAKWDGFAAQTSVVPFGAIAGGRQSLKLGEIGWWRLALGALAWAGVVAIHPMLFGVSPLPGR